MTAPTYTRQYQLPKTDGIHNLIIKEAPLAPLKSTEVLVKIHAVSLNYRDLIIATGNYRGEAKRHLVPCSDMAGEVIAVGNEVKKWTKGDRVCANFNPEHLAGDIEAEMVSSALGAMSTDGVLAEYRPFRADCLVSIPDHLSFQEASTLPCAGVTAWNALQGPVPLKGGDTVLCLGTGGVSVFAIQLAAAMGANVIVTSSSDAKLEAVKKLGANHTINYRKHPNWDQEVLKITNGKGAKHVIEVGGPGTIQKSMNCLHQVGWIQVMGFVAGEGQVGDIPLSCILKAAMLRGIMVGSRAQFEDMNKLFSVRQLKPVVDTVFSFERARDAYEYLQSQKHVGKVVIQVSKDT